MMRIVIAAEVIKQPLTGIGRYAWELVTRLSNHQLVRSIECLAYGKWRTLEEITAIASSQNGATANDKDNNLYRKLMQYPAFGNAYQIIMPFLAKARVSSKNMDIFHGPNYFVPKVDIPCVATIHDLSTFINPNWHPASRATRINKIILRSIENARLIITDSYAVRSEAISYFGLAENRVIAVPLGVGVSFSPRAFAELEAPLSQYDLKPGDYCLCVSTIEPRKNITGLISAYRELPLWIRTHWPLVLVGERGWNSDDIHLDITQGVKEGWLKYLGFVPQKHLPFLYAGCRLFVYPSLYEGFGLPIVEAMASGVPVLTSNRSSMPEVAGGAAWLVDPEDKDALREGLRAALEDELWQSEAVMLGLHRAKELNWEACVTKTMDVYRSALNM